MSTSSWRLRIATTTALAMGMFLVAGCAENTVTETAGLGENAVEMGIDLGLEDGGLSTSAESPNFGDPYFANYLGDDLDVEVKDDPLTTDARLVDVERHPDVEVKYLRVVWGNMSRGPEADGEAVLSDSEATDWTGQATVSDGIIMPIRTIRFERNDFIIPPWRQDDPSRQKVQWVSHTKPGKDGIVFKIVIPAKDDDTLERDAALSTNRDGLTEDDMFTFRTGPLSIQFPISKLQDLEELVMVDDKNGVSFVGFDKDDIDHCPRGTLEGAWVRVENDDRLGGFFRARWMGPLGRVTGHVRGRWGVLDGGERVFVGKIIGRDGRYVGHMRGSWEHGDVLGHGTFGGGWGIHDPNRPDRGLEGRVGGAWVVSDRIENGGFLRGVWKSAGCDTRDGGGTDGGSTGGTGTE